MRPEDELTQNIAIYLNLQYPNVLYHFDTGSGAKMSIGMAVRNKRLNKHRGYPDLFIAEPKGEWHGLFIEIKKDNKTMATATRKATPHVLEQAQYMHKLISKGYSCAFGIGFNECKKLIDEYLK